MRVLAKVKPSPEQLTIICINPSGSVLIRGAAGSGKTTTALLRLKYLADYWTRRRRSEGSTNAVQILVLTFNRTLRGYVEELAKEQVDVRGAILEVRTFASWATELLGYPNVTQSGDTIIRQLGEKLRLDPQFLVDEVHYALGRFLPEQIDQYLDCRRSGRGSTPQVPRTLRARIIAEVIQPYVAWKQSNSAYDWNDLAVKLAEQQLSEYDIIIVDEAQDFSANQTRAVLNQLTEDGSLTLVLDAAQRIYPNAFQWKEVGIPVIAGKNVYTLKINFRNTIEIARLAVPLLEGVELLDDGTIPDFHSSSRHGPRPVVLRGRFSGQLQYALNYIRNNVKLSSESVAFLLAKGGRWFNAIREGLAAEGIDYAEITRTTDWPGGNENVALCTMHSAKGLEFDHVIILGLNAQVTPHGNEEGDAEMDNLRRLLAMAVGRARTSLIIGYKPQDASSLISVLTPETYDLVDV
jgi:superfamily I DNA/RNA helicase